MKDVQQLKLLRVLNVWKIIVFVDRMKMYIVITNHSVEKYFEL